MSVEKTLHMVFDPQGRMILHTAAKKQKAAVLYFMADRDGTWQEAVSQGYRAMKVFATCVDRTEIGMQQNANLTKADFESEQDEMG